MSKLYENIISYDKWWFVMFMITFCLEKLNAVLLHIPWLDESVFSSWTGTLWYQQQRAQQAERQGTGTSQVFFQSQNVTPHAIGWLWVVFICMCLAGIFVSRSSAVRERGRDLCRQVWLFFFFFFWVFDVYLAISLHSFDFPVSKISNVISLDSDGIFR